MAANNTPGNSANPPPTSAPKDEFLPPAQTHQGGMGGSKMMTGLVILIVVMVIAGAGTFFGLSGLTSSSTSGPSSSSQCVGTGCHKISYHDAQVFSPFASASAGSPVSFSVTIPTGVIASTVFNFGDGTNMTVSGSTASATHTYSSAGVYYVFVQSTDTSGNVHDNLDHVAPIRVTPSFLQIQSGQVAVVNGVNTTSASVSAGGTVSLQGEVQAPPTGAGWSITAVGFQSLSSYVTVSSCSCNGSTRSATTTATVASGAPNGVYTVVFFTESTNGVQVAYGNFSFSIGVGVTVVTPPVAKSPHPGVADVYYLVPGGSFSEDPAVDYETAGYEPIVNVYQTLVSYNGSLAGPYPTDFVPNLATCVPGSSLCTSLYGNSLQSGDNYTFVINPHAMFYNPNTKTSANVYPIDVLYSYARTCLFSTWPSYETNPGWIQCQALLPGGNASWDAGMHAPLNSTPSNILNAITMNGTACPASATSGCVTFDTQYSGEFWPDFLEFVADPLGGGILDCNYLVSIGNTIPGLSCGATSNPSAPAPTAWDTVQLGLSTGGTDYSGVASNGWAQTVRWSMVGSGPYYLASLTPGTSYSVQANPSWSGTPTCTWVGCLPTTFPLQTVNVVWESEAVQGETAFQQGQADLATIPATDFSSVLIPMLHAGTAGLSSAPGLSIYFTNFDQYFSQTGAESLLTGTGATLNAPSDLFQDLNFRQFLIHAFPYATVQSQYNTIDGIPLDQLYGGAIPIGMGNYYPQNISWDMQDPSSASSSPNDALYWWNLDQADKGIGAQSCLTSKPCVFPLLTYAGAPLQDEIMNAWISQITKLSNGAVVPVKVDLPFINLVINSFSPPGTNPMPIYELGWAPDFPDPTDYISPLYTPDGTYTYGDALCEAWIASSSCVGAPLNAANYNNPCPANWVWANASVTTACQGTAYSEVASLIGQAAFDTNLTQRAFLYNELEHITQQLGIFVPNPGQAITEWVTASWINGATMNANPTIGGGGDSTWYTVQYT